MTPFDIAVMFGDDEVNVHLVYAWNQDEALRSVMLYYKDSTVIGVMFGANNKE